MRRSGPSTGELSRLLERWVAQGIITVDQAEQMRADAAANDAVASGDGEPAVRTSALAMEALGYLGGVLALVAAGLCTGALWGDLPVGGQLMLVAAVTAVLLGAGAAVPLRSGGGTGAAEAAETAGAAEPGGARGAASRLRAVLWSLGAVSLAAVLGLFAEDVLEWRADATVLLAAAGAAIAAAALWRRHRHGLLQLTVLGATAVAATAATALLPDPDHLAGLALWAVGTGWAILAWGGLTPPRPVGLAAGSAVAVVGAVVVSFADAAAGATFAVAAVCALAAAAVAVRRLVVLAVAVVGALVVFGVVLERYVSGLWQVAAVLLAVGLLLVAAAVLATRKGARPAPSRPAPEWTAGPPRPARVATAVLVAGTAVVILVLGLA